MDTSDTDSLAKVALAELLGSTEPQAQEATPPPAKPAGEPPTETAKPAEPDPVEAAASQSSLVARALKRIAERERAVAERENAVAKPAEQAWTKARQKANLFEYIEKELGMDPGTATRALMARVLGDKAPDEYRNLDQRLKDEGNRDAAMDELRGEITSLKAKLEGKDQSDTAAKIRADYQRELDTHLTGDLSTYPNASKAMQDDREWAVGALWTIVSADARAKAERVRSGGAPEAPMTPAEAMKALDGELGRLARMFGKTEPAAGAPATKTEPAPITTKDTQARKTLVNISPSKPELQKDPEDIEANYDAALHWFKSL